MKHPLITKRDKLISQLRGTPGFISVGLAKRRGDVVLLVAVDESFRGSIPETFEGIGVVVEDLGQARSEFKRRKSQ